MVRFCAAVLSAVVDLCNAAGIEPVYTTYEGQSPETLAELVEYCYGGANTTYGKMRIETDSHPEPYRIKYFECVVILITAAHVAFIFE